MWIVVELLEGWSSIAIFITRGTAVFGEREREGGERE